MMRRLLLIAFIYLYSAALLADNYTAIAIEAEKNKSEIIKNYLQLAIDAKRNSESRINKKDSNHSKIIIFVSFSMPDQSIVSLLQDAKKIHASIVIRGLIHNSFKETFIKMASIVKQADGGGVELNPPIFRKFNIQKVPAIVVLPESEMCASEKICSENKYDVVYGDIPVLDALKMIRDHGTVSQKIAEQLISSFGDTFHV